MKTPIQAYIVAALLLTSASLRAVDFAEFYSEPKKADLLSYLAETVSMSDKVAAGDEKTDVLEMRNRIDQIYSFYMLRFSPELESKVVGNLKIAANRTKSEYVKGEITTVLEIIAKKRSDSYKESLDLVAWAREQEKKKPNQAIVPTPASVTPAAGAPVAPDTGAAEL